MVTGIVSGTVVSTVKDKRLLGVKLLIVRRLVNGEFKDLVVCADATRQAGIGDFVYMIGSKEATLPFNDREMIPVDLSIIGFVDRYDDMSMLTEMEKPC